MKPSTHRTFSRPVRIVCASLIVCLWTFVLSLTLQLKGYPFEDLSPLGAGAILTLCLGRKSMTWAERLTVILIIVILAGILFPKVVSHGCR